MTKLSLNESIISSEDLREVIAEVEEFRKYLAHNAIKQRVTQKYDHELPDLSLRAKEAISDWQNNKELSIESLERLIIELNSFLKSAPRITVTLAALPSINLKKQVSSWCRANLATSVLIDFSYNSALLGGMVVVCGSHIYDWSMRRQILASKDKLNEVIRRV